MSDDFPEKKLVSIIVPAYNAEATLSACLLGCLNQTYPRIEVIVVDDGSTDKTGNIARSYGVKLIQQDNSGPASARNRGVRESSGEFVAFTDSDCLPEPDWIEKLLQEFSEGVVGVGGSYGIANPECFLARMIHEEIRLRHAGFAKQVDFLGSFNAMFRRDAFESIGGFDESFSMASAEDNDLSYRLIDAGGKLFFASDAIVKHFHPCRLAPYLRTQARHGYWRVKLYVKHPGRSYGGDRYAGLPDLLAPGVALLFCVSLIMAPALRAIGVKNAGYGCLASAIVYMAFRAALPLRLVRSSGDARMFLFGIVAAMRDAARGAGMVLGCFRFMTPGRGKR